MSEPRVFSAPVDKFRLNGLPEEKPQENNATFHFKLRPVGEACSGFTDGT